MKSRDLASLFFVGALFGASFLFMRTTVPEFGPIPLIEMRVAIAALFLLPILWLRGGFNVLRKQAGPLLLMGVINAALPFPLMAYALLSLSAGTGSIMNATTPLFGALVACVWLRERLTWLRVLGLLISFAGVVVLVWEKDFGGKLGAIAAASCAALLFGVGANYSKKHLGSVDPIAIAAGCQLGATIVLLPFALWLWPHQPPSLQAWLNVGVLGVASTGIAFALLFQLIRRVGPAKAVTVTFLAPVFGVIWGAFFLNEAVGVNILTGGCLVLLGTAFATGTILLPARLSRTPAVE